MSNITQLAISRSSAPVPTRTRANIVSALLLLAPLALGGLMTAATTSVLPVIIGAIVGLISCQAPKVAKQWEKAVILRLGKYRGLHGPGLFWIMPFVDSVSAWVDQRIITTNFAAEQTLTSDTVPVNVDAVLF